MGSYRDRLYEWAVSVAKLARLQASLLVTDAVLLPLAYHAAGKRLEKLDNLPAFVQEKRDAVLALVDRQTSEDAFQVSTSPPRHGMPRRAVRWLRSVFARATGAVQLHIAYIDLGRIHSIASSGGVDQAGDTLASVPLDDISALLASRKELQESTDGVKARYATHFFSPQRALAAALILPVLFLLVSLISSGGRGAASASPGGGSRSTVANGLGSDARQGWALAAAGYQSPWKCESDSGYNNFGQVIDAAVASVIGAGSSHFSESSFCGVALGSDISSVVEKNAEYKGCFIPIAAPDSSGFKVVRGASTFALADKETNRVVCVIVRYDGTPLDTLIDDVRSKFGPTSNEIKQWQERIFGGYTVGCAYARWNFYRTSVVVFCRGNDTWITVADKDFVTAELRKCANAVLTSAKWMARVVDVNVHNTGAPIVEALADTTVQVAPRSSLALCVDDGLKQRMAADRKNGKRFESEDDPRTCDVAGVITETSDAMCAALVDPLASPSVGLRRLHSRGASDQGLPCTLYDSAFMFMFWDIANTLMQNEFPPSSKQIQAYFPEDFYLRRSGHNYGNDERCPPEERWGDFHVRSIGPRYEWVDENNQRVSVGRNLMLSLGRPR